MQSYDKPRTGNGTYRIGDSDDLVLIERMNIPPEKIYLKDYAIIIICTQGRAQFEYDGHLILIQKNDFFLYMAHSIATNFMASTDFNCRQIWFTRAEFWSIKIFSNTKMTDMYYLKLHPVLHLTDDNAALLNDYFHLLCQRMSAPQFVPQKDIVRSLFGTMLLEILSMIRRTKKGTAEDEGKEADVSLHKKQMVDKFMRLVEQDDGRNRRVDYYAEKMCITPKYLSTIMREVMNRRPSIYIQMFTLKAIKHRLCFTDMTVQEIAHDLQFPNASFLGKYFKQHVGMTPMEFRSKYHNVGIKKEL